MYTSNEMQYACTLETNAEVHVYTIQAMCTLHRHTLCTNERLHSNKKQKQTVCELNSKYVLVNTQILYSKKLKTSSQKPAEHYIANV